MFVCLFSSQFVSHRAILYAWRYLESGEVRWVSYNSLSSRKVDDAKSDECCWSKSMLSLFIPGFVCLKFFTRRFDESTTRCQISDTSPKTDSSRKLRNFPINICRWIIHASSLCDAKELRSLRRFHDVQDSCCWWCSRWCQSQRIFSCLYLLNSSIRFFKKRRILARASNKSLHSTDLTALHTSKVLKTGRNCSTLLLIIPWKNLENFARSLLHVNLKQKEILLMVPAG